nr:helix-turn-helix domain-containing protein [uncultured Lachnoclostridium sp.]
MEITKLIMNPARLRIIQFISARSRVRISEVIDYLEDIPRATVYHHMKILEENNMIEVVEENRIRGTVEKIYTLKQPELMLENENPIALSTAFHLGLMQEMNQYYSKEDRDHKKDNVFFTTSYLNVTEEEYSYITGEIFKLITPYITKSKTKDCKVRKLSIVSSPPEEQEG